MKILVIGLDCAAPELLFGDERLENLRRLMAGGCYGRLESIVPPITVPAWMCMATSQDPGSLGVYGFRNRVDHSYDGLGIVSSRSIGELALWDQVAREGKRSVVIGVPPGYPPRKVNGVSVGCFLTPDTAKDIYTHPAEIGPEIERLVGSYPVDVKGFRTNNKSWLKGEIDEMTRKHFAVVRHYLKHTEWDYFQFVEIGLDRLQHGFWKYHDPAHVLHEPDSPFGEVIRDYYRTLDEEVGSLLELLTDDTVVLVVSDHGARRLDGGFCVNEWLIRRGPARPEPLPREGHAVREARRELGSDAGLERGGLLRARLLQCEGTRAARRDRAVGLRAVPRRNQGAVRGDRGPRGGAAGDARVPARGGLPRRCAGSPRT